MYDEYKIIDGVLHYRMHPKGKWEPCSPAQTVGYIRTLKEQNDHLYKKVFVLSKALNEKPVSRKVSEPESNEVLAYAAFGPLEPGKFEPAGWYVLEKYKDGDWVFNDQWTMFFDLWLPLPEMD